MQNSSDMITDNEINWDYQDGYDDGLKFHIDLDYTAKNEERYQDNEHYRRGFDQAGDDS